MKKKISVAVLGATGSVGQKFITLLANHPYFEVTEVSASSKSEGKLYKDAVNWIQSETMPKYVGELVVKNNEPVFRSNILFSSLDSEIAGEVESNLANSGYRIISNSKNHRLDKDVPLLIPEVNFSHLDILKSQKYNGGCIVTNPNCSTIGLVLALKPLLDKFGIESVNVVTMQALSGAGYPGVSSLDIIDNVIPFISGEEEKLETELLKILGKVKKNRIENIDIKVSASANRVAVIDGHLELVQIKLKKKATKENIINSWKNFSSEPQNLKLPTAPTKPLYYFYEDNYPQPKLHRNLDKGMAVAIGRLRECKIFDYKFAIMSHNTIRGAAGGSILCAELMYAKGLLK